MREGGCYLADIVCRHDESKCGKTNGGASAAKGQQRVLGVNQHRGNIGGGENSKHVVDIRLTDFDLAQPLEPTDDPGLLEIETRDKGVHFRECKVSRDPEANVVFLPPQREANFTFQRGDIRRKSNMADDVITDAFAPTAHPRCRSVGIFEKVAHGVTVVDLVFLLPQPRQHFGTILKRRLPVHDRVCRVGEGVDELDRILEHVDVRRVCDCDQ